MFVFASSNHTGLRLVAYLQQQWQTHHILFHACLVLLANFLVAHNTILDVYQHVLWFSAQEDVDPLQLIVHYDIITNVVLPLLEVISEDPAATRLHQGAGLFQQRLHSHRFQSNLMISVQAWEIGICSVF